MRMLTDFWSRQGRACFGVPAFRALLALVLLVAGSATAQAQISITGGDGQIAPVNTLLGTPLSVHVIDNSTGMPAVGSDVIFTVTAGDASFQLNSMPAVTVQTDNNGDASVFVQLGPNKGPITVHADSIDFGTVDFNLLSNYVMTILGGDGQTAAVNTTLAQAFTVRVSDGFGAPVPGIAANIGVLSSNGFIVQSGGQSYMANTDSGGQITFNVTAGGTPGTMIVQVDTGITVAAYVNFFATLTGSGTLGIVSGNNQTGAVNTTLPQPLISRVLDGMGTPVPNATVVYTVTSGSATFVASGNNTFVANTDASGQLAAAVNLGPAAGAIVITADAGPYGMVTFNATSSAAATLTLSIVGGDGQSGQVNTTLGQDLVVKVVDGAMVPQSGQTITYTVVAGTATFTQSGTNTYTTVTGTGGTAAATLALGGQPGPVQVSAGGAGLAPVTFSEMATAQPFNISAASGNGQSANVGQTLSQPLVVHVTDQLGIGVGKQPVQFSVTSGSAFLAGLSVTTFNTFTDANGDASTTVTFGDTPGSVVVTASISGNSVAFSLTATAPPTLSMDIVSGNGQSGVTNQSGQPLVVSVSANGVLQSNQAVDWAVTIGSSVVTLGAASTNSGSNGQASNTLSFGNNPGSAMISATLRADPRVSASFTVSSSAPQAQTSVLSLLSGAGQSGPTGTVADAPFVFHLTTNGQPLSGQPVSFSVLSGSGTLSTSSASTDSAGNASTTLTYGASAGTVVVQASAFGGSLNATASATAIVPGISITGGDGQSAIANTKLAQPLAICICSAAASAPGKSLAGVNVSWTVVSGGGHLKDAVTLTDGSGRASNEFTLGATLGIQQVRASVAGGGSVTFVATATVDGTAVLEIVSGNNQTVATGGTAGDPLVVRLRTASGQVVSGVAIAFASDPVGAVTLSPASAVTDSSGQASTRAALMVPPSARIIASVPANSSIAAVSFSINGGIANTSGLSETQAAVAMAVDNTCTALASASNLTPIQQDLLARCRELSGSAAGSPAQVQNILQQLTNDEAAAQTSSAVASVGAQFDNIKGRMAALRGGARGFSTQGLALANGSGSLPLSFLPSAIAANAAQDKEAEVGADFTRWGFFATGTIVDGNRDPTASSAGYDFGSRGLTAGVDYRFNDKLVAGAALGYNKSDTKLDGDRGKLNTHGVSLSGYASYYYGREIYTDTVLSYGRNAYDLSRRIQYSITLPNGSTSSVDQIAKGSPDGTQLSFALTAGRDFVHGPWSFGPYVRGTYTRIDFDGYSERMSNPTGPGAGLALAVDSRTVSSREGVLGGKLSYTASTSFGVLMPNVQFEYVHDFSSDPDAVVSRFVFDPTATVISINGDPVDNQYFNIGVGLSAVFANGRSGFLYIERRAGQTGTSQTSLALGLRIEF